MYIQINGTSYPCGRPTFSAGTLRWPGVEGLELPIAGTVQTCRDDGFVMREDDAADWARQLYEGNVLTLTNAPEQPPDLEALRENKAAELSAACEQAIFAGLDIQLPGGETEHFDYSERDQINIKEMFDAVQLGATQFPYQSEDGSCRVYAAEEILTIYATLAGHKTGQLTYYHQLKEYINTLETAGEIEAVTYGQPLTGAYLEHYTQMMAVAQEQMGLILAGGSSQ